MCKSKIMVLGTFHFHQEGVEYLDIQSEQRQKEVLDVVNRISLFKPNKIAVECVPENITPFNERYHKYLDDGIINTSNIEDTNEIVMLGFQIAKICGISNLHAIDYRNNWLRDDVMSYAKNNQPFVADKILKKQNEFVNNLFKNINKPLNKVFYFLNSSDNINRQHSDTFLIYNQIGTSNDYYGTKFVSSWYDRNLRIFSNLQRIADEGRILIIIGFGHCALLNHFIEEYYPMEFESPLPYLK